MNMHRSTLLVVMIFMPLQIFSKGPNSVVYKPISGVSVTYIYPENVKFVRRHIAGIKGFIPSSFRHGRRTKQQRLFVESITNTHFIVHRKVENDAGYGSGIMYKVKYEVVPNAKGFKLVLSPVGVDTYHQGLIGRFRLPKFTIQDLLNYLKNNRQAVLYNYSILVRTGPHATFRNMQKYAQRALQKIEVTGASTATHYFRGANWSAGFRMLPKRTRKGTQFNITVELPADRSKPNTMDYAKSLSQVKQFIAKGTNSKSRFVMKMRMSVKRFRHKLKVGDYSHCGLVVAVNKPVAKLQTSAGEHWLRIDKLYPKRSMPCKFVNNKYVDP